MWPPQKRCENCDHWRSPWWFSIFGLAREDGYLLSGQREDVEELRLRTALHVEPTYGRHVISLRLTFGWRQIKTSFNVYWMATFDDYDGAPDSSPSAKLMGTGRTEQEAIENLIEQATDLER